MALMRDQIRRRQTQENRVEGAADAVSCALSETDWQALLAGSPGARKKFYEAYADTLYRAIRSWARVSPEEAEDLLGETFLRAFRGLSGARGRQTLEGWLFTLGRHAVVDFCRKRGRQARELHFDDLSIAAREKALAVMRGPGEGSQAPQWGGERAELSALVGQTLAQMPARQQQVLVAKYFDNQANPQIAQKLALDTEAVASLLYRARIAFRTLFRRSQKTAQSQDPL
jgi:RNA polymerase sigma-70 factor (ECF subfamily)